MGTLAGSLHKVLLLENHVPCRADPDGSTNQNGATPDRISRSGATLRLLFVNDS